MACIPSAECHVHVDSSKVINGLILRKFRCSSCERVGLGTVMILYSIMSSVQARWRSSLRTRSVPRLDHFPLLLLLYSRFFYTAGRSASHSCCYTLHIIHKSSLCPRRTLFTTAELPKRIVGVRGFEHGGFQVISLWSLDSGPQKRP